MRTERVESGITVNVINFGPVLEEAWKERPDPKYTGYRIHGKYGYVTTKNGDIYVLDDDGAGAVSPINDEFKLEIGLYGIPPQDNPDEKIMELFPAFGVALRKEQILALPSDFKLDLSEFIRRFGARLESNYAQWVEALSPLL